MAATPKYVYFFGGGQTEGKGHQKDLLGGKGAGLAEMTSIGLPVPAGFTLTIDCCNAYYRRKNKWPPGLEKQVRANLTKLEKACKEELGGTKNPLLLSVRSGAAASMPGMMETILNLGLNDKSVEALARVSNNRRFALDAYRRLIMMYGSTAMGINREHFESAFDDLKATRTRVRLGKERAELVADTDVNDEELEALVDTFKDIYQRHTHEPFPQDPIKQVFGAIEAVFMSWNSDKAVTYRRVEKIVGLSGTAVNVQQMVFGNMGDDCATGVCFTRDPSTGANVFYGDVLINAQGEDVVAGVRTPISLAELKRLMPEAYDRLEAVRAILELHFRDMQDLEFTIERNNLYMLQCRTGKRSPEAAFRIAVEQATAPLLSKKVVDRLVRKRYLPKRYAARAAKPIITKSQAVQRIKPVDIERLFYTVLDPNISFEQRRSSKIGHGINAVPGAACGKVAFNAADAEKMAAGGEPVILVRRETSPEDVAGMFVAAGILTATGGKTSHAAVVARGWGKCCIVGCDSLRIDYDKKNFSFGNGDQIHQGQLITLDGSKGEVFKGELPLVSPRPPKEYKKLMNWADAIRKLKVRANADTPGDAAKAVEMGAEGIGLCRTEHMFFDSEERRLAMQQMILAKTEYHRRQALERLLPFQRDDFIGIFEAMKGMPVTIRLIDPPLHEFLPRTPEDIDKLSRLTGIPAETINYRIEQLHESNPMLGHRGCRLYITYPEILEMQVRAIMEAAVDCRKRKIAVHPEIMIPLVIDAKELRILTDLTHKVAREVLDNSNAKISYMVGAMVETPRAAILADRIAEVAEFVSFGTNDLTQTTMALSRDDAGRFLPEYVDPDKAAIFPAHPFHSLDEEGVGFLIRHAIDRSRSTRPKIKIGICGEHGGELESVKFCYGAGMDYVSCSPFGIPVARLAAAQAVLDAPRSEPRPSGSGAGRGSGKKVTPKKKARTVKPKAKKRSRRS